MQETQFRSLNREDALEEETAPWYSCLEKEDKKRRGQSRLVGCSPWGHKESDMTAHTDTRAMGQAWAEHQGRTVNRTDNSPCPEEGDTY